MKTLVGKFLAIALFVSFFSAYSYSSSACTMEFAYMYNPQTGSCVEAVNGCAIDELLGKGFERVTTCSGVSSSDNGSSSSSSSDSNSGYDSNYGRRKFGWEDDFQDGQYE